MSEFGVARPRLARLWLRRRLAGTHKALGKTDRAPYFQIDKLNVI
jgi:hypothetical protein